MVLCLTALSDDSIEKVLAAPVLIWSVIAPDETDFIDIPVRQGFFSRLFGKKPPKSEPVPKLEFGDGELMDTDLDKAWHGIHFLLTGSDWEGDPPLNFLVAGGTEVGDIDVGYGPVRVFRALEVADINNALSKVTEDYLRTRFEPDIMTKKGIYPEIWDKDSEDDDTFSYLLGYFDELKSFICDAVSKNLGIVVSMQ
ncbi:MAG: YfbM family protein [Desulfobacteraceae bacterium]|nr:YfbM family protein [Desulfobacteraceae bacterium]